ncbi:MAG: glycerophosphodiester phosphodiesterase family protein [Eubacterium sp.]|jgi:Glycerophosphoryl diester phosphodiesterase|nr:glycerophosphodiester phosphodiesterase family protein [Eubacterium sp.]
MYSKNKELRDAAHRKKVLVAAHRGTCGGSVVQNTVLSYQNALLHGADMIEVDVSMTIDGVFFAFHNGEEPVELGIKRDIREMTAAEVESKKTLNSLREYVGQKVERLDMVLERFRGKCFINIDRSWFYWDKIIPFLKAKEMDAQILLKSGVHERLLSELAQSGTGLMYMPIVKTMEEWETVKKYDINVAAAELIFSDLNGRFTDPAFLKELLGEGILPWVNVIRLNDETILSGGLDDNLAIGEGFEKSWGRLIDLGYKVLQTDWPALLRNYVDEKVHSEQQ